jgi:hypothetical protein
MQIAHYRNALDDPLAGELQHQTEDAVRRGMLRAHVEDELLDLALFDLDDRELIARSPCPVGDPSPVDPPAPDVGGGYLFIRLE